MHQPPIRRVGAALLLSILGLSARASAETLFVSDFDHVRGYDTTTRPAAATREIGIDNLGTANTVAVGPDGKVYVFDQGANLNKSDIDRFEPDGTFLGVWSAATGLVAPEKMLFGPGGDLFVVDRGADPIGVYRFDGTTGARKGLFTSGTTLEFPFGIAFDDQGRLYLSDPTSGTSRVIRYSSEGVYEDAVLVHKSQKASDLVNYPRGLCFGTDKLLYVVDHLDEKIYRYDPEADSIAEYASVAGASPQDCAFGDDGTLYVDAFGPNGILPIVPPVGENPAMVGTKFATDLPAHRVLAISDATLVPIGSTTSSTSSTTLQELLCGDTNDDGKINSSDALRVLKGAVGTLSCPLAVCDTDASGKLTAGDALRVLKKAVGQVVTLLCP